MIETLLIVGLVGTAFVLALIPASIAHLKGYSFLAWWIFGVVAFPFAVWGVVTGRADQTILDEDRLNHGWKRCGACAELVRGPAKLCRYCGTAF